MCDTKQNTDLQLVKMKKKRNDSCPTFLFENHDVRVQVGEKGDLWFVARDVAAALDITWSGQTLSKIQDSWVTMLELNMVTGRKEIVGINEAAVYKLAFRSNKPEAERFTNWVAEVVLPVIRKNGGYHVNQGSSGIYEQAASKIRCGFEAGTSYKGLAILLGCSESLANAQTVQYLKREMDLDATSLLTENIADTKDSLVIPSEMAGEIGVSARELNLRLQKKGLQNRIEYESNGKIKKRWDLTPAGSEYAEILDVGKIHSDGTPVQQIKWFKNKTLQKLRDAS
jgi:prophage antirepressor-like protein